MEYRLSQCQECGIPQNLPNFYVYNVFGDVQIKNNINEI